MNWRRKRLVGIAVIGMAVFAILLIAFVKHRSHVLSDDIVYNTRSAQTIDEAIALLGRPSSRVTDLPIMSLSIAEAELCDKLIWEFDNAFLILIYNVSSGHIARCVVVDKPKSPSIVDMLNQFLHFK